MSWNGHWERSICRQHPRCSLPEAPAQLAGDIIAPLIAQPLGAVFGQLFMNGAASLWATARSCMQVFAPRWPSVVLTAGGVLHVSHAWLAGKPGKQRRAQVVKHLSQAGVAGKVRSPRELSLRIRRETRGVERRPPASLKRRRRQQLGVSK